MTFSADDAGTYAVRSVRTNQCFDAYNAADGGQVGTWGCGSQDNQRWRVLRNPAGDLSLRLVRGGLCLGAIAPTAGSSLAMHPCDLSRGVRWRIGSAAQ